MSSAFPLRLLPTGGSVEALGSPSRLGCHSPSSYSWDMGRQLVLIEERPQWRLDEASKERGRRGLAAARAALAEASRRAAA
jgi:hypothetical protein